MSEMDKNKPLVGILTDVTRNPIGSLFGSRTHFIKQLITVGKKQANFIVFSLQDIEWRKEKVLGYKLNEKGQWTRVKMPLPDAIFNRLLNRRMENSKPFQQLRKLVIRKNIPLFNWNYFNKIDIYKIVTSDEGMSIHVPDYIFNPTVKQMTDMLERHRTVFLKPSGGSLGIGIYKIAKSSDKEYTLGFYKDKSNIRLTFQSLLLLMQYIRKREGNKLQHYLVQQGINLIHMAHCPIDFRFHLNKNGDKGWVITSVAAKKAGNGSITTHLRNGGKIVKTKSSLEHAFGKSSTTVLRNAKSVAIKLANVIELHHGYWIGEIGFDLGIDQDKRIWMFEANSKPGRSIFKHPSLKEAGMLSLRYIVNHCVYLSKLRGKVRHREPLIASEMELISTD